MAALIGNSSAFDFKGSQLVDLVGEQLGQLTRECESESRVRKRWRTSPMLFLPWHSAAAEDPEETPVNFAAELGLPLLFLPRHYSITHDARMLGDLISKLCDEKTSSDLREALEKLPFSSRLEEAVLDGIRKLENRRKRLAIVAMKSGADADTAMSRILDWTSELEMEAVLVLAHKRPSGRVASIQLPLDALRQDIYKLLDLRPPETKQSLPFIPSAESKPKRVTFYDRLKGYLGRSTAHSTGTGPADTDADDYVDKDWADMLARFSGSNWASVDSVAKEWWALDETASKYLDGLMKKIALKPDNFEEKQSFEGRLRYLAMLRALYPQVFEAAARELDGADQLYRIHLILCGHTGRDSLVSGSLLPFWRDCLEDPLFCEISYACFHAVGRKRALVDRFESRAQLHRLLTWLDHPPDDSETTDDKLVELLEKQQTWLELLSENVLEDPDQVGEMTRIAATFLEGSPRASDALQAAQVVLSAYEFSADEKSSIEDEIFKLVDKLARMAINQSAGAIRFDAALLRARAFCLARDGMTSREILRVTRRNARDELTRCAVQIEEAFVHERERDFFGAIQIYQAALLLAEGIGADELVARAASGCMRCEAIADLRDLGAAKAIRARVIVQIQAARAPELFPLSKRAKPRVFVSYRSETQAITKSIAAVLSGSPLESWNDKKLEAHQDFGPTIHRELHDSDAVVLLLSPDYFRSPWCVSELHFALGQHEIRGIPLFWAWCSNNPLSGRTCELAARDEIKESFKEIEVARRGYELAHVEERLKRLFSRSQLLFREAIAYDKSVDSVRAGEWLKPLCDAAPHIYSRSKLRQTDFANPFIAPVMRLST